MTHRVLLVRTQLLDVVPLTCLKMSEYNMNIARSTSDLNRIFELLLCEVLQQEGERKAERKGKEKEQRKERERKALTAEILV